ncbi:hypothetical protein J4526_06840 [Desulfurococcaceae archaeon MEX13E-LK6-19]|nr:hypothetical protein J4526_06840 [Desulfurococcaceae archaeon MEX13E-LK6-19]
MSSNGGNMFTLCFLGVTLPPWLIKLYEDSIEKGLPLETQQVRLFVKRLENRETDFFDYILESDLVNCSRVFLETIDDETVACSVNNKLPHMIVFDKNIPIKGETPLSEVKREIVVKAPRFVRELLLALYMLPDEYRVDMNNIVTNHIIEGNPSVIARSFVFTNIVYLKTIDEIEDLRDIIRKPDAITEIGLVIPRREMYFYRLLRIPRIKGWSVEHSSSISRGLDTYVMKIHSRPEDIHIALNILLLNSLLASVRTYFDMFIDVFRRARNLYTSTIAMLYEKPLMNIFITSNILKKMVKMYPSYTDAISYLDRFIHETKAMETHISAPIMEEEKPSSIVEAESRALMYVNEKILDYVRGLREAVSDTGETLITQIHSLGTLIQLQRTVSALIVTSIGILINVLRILLIEILKLF